MDRSELLYKVMDQLRLDLEFKGNDTSALEELLNSIPDEALIKYLPEEDFDHE